MVGVMVGVAVNEFVGVTLLVGVTDLVGVMGCGYGDML